MSFQCSSIDAGSYICFSEQKPASTQWCGSEVPGKSQSNSVEVLLYSELRAIWSLRYRSFKNVQDSSSRYFFFLTLQELCQLVPTVARATKLGSLGSPLIPAPVEPRFFNVGWPGYLVLPKIATGFRSSFNKHGIRVFNPSPYIYIYIRVVSSSWYSKYNIFGLHLPWDHFLDALFCLMVNSRWWICPHDSQWNPYQSSRKMDEEKIPKLRSHVG